MRTSALKGLLAAVTLGGGASICSAQASYEIPNSPPIVVTAGQGGAILLPRLVNVGGYALTGEPSESRQSQRRWQRQSGPVYRVGQGDITLLASR